MLKTKNAKIKNDSGQLLIESMVGIGVALIGLMGILGLISRSASINRVISQQFIGNYLASEGIEIVKNIIDANIIQGKPWNQGFSNSGSFEVDYTSLNLLPNQNRQLLFDSNSLLYSYQRGNQVPISRTINIQPIGSNEVKVNSVVNWTTRGGAAFSVNLEDHFFNWRP